MLTSDDLNALIEENPEFKGMVYVKVEGDEVKGQVSIPLDKLDFGMVRGRYLNGEADFKASLSDGVLIVTIESVEVNGQESSRGRHDRDSQAKSGQGRLQGSKKPPR